MANRYRSGYEKEIKKNSDSRIKYEPDTLNYVLKPRRYTPDFKLPNGIYVEAKGNFRTSSDRTKLIAVKAQNPHIELRLLFQNPNLKLNKNSKTTYAMWAEKCGFIWAEGVEIPDAWVKEQRIKK